MKVLVPAEADGLRIDVFLAEFCEEIPTRSAAQKILALNGKNKNLRVRAGEVISCEIPAPAPLGAAAEDIPLCIVYEDSDLLVVDKPRGLVVHPAAGHHSGTLVNALLFHCELSAVGGVLRPGIVHRLDKDTSGLMVVAKNDAAHAALAAQLESREMGREYNAICVGAVKKPRLRIDLPIGRHLHDRKKMAVLTEPNARARKAVTNIEVLERFSSKPTARNFRAVEKNFPQNSFGAGSFTLIAARLETGRTHQIRVHMAHIGNPVLGDPLYGGLRYPAKSGFSDGQILHAVKLRFTHPTTGGEMEFISDLPEYFKEAIRVVRGNL